MLIAGGKRKGRSGWGCDGGKGDEDGGKRESLKGTDGNPQDGEKGEQRRGMMDVNRRKKKGKKNHANKEPEPETKRRKVRQKGIVLPEPMDQWTGGRWGHAVSSAPAPPCRWHWA